MKICLLLILLCVVPVYGAAQTRIRPPPTVERLKQDKPLVEDAIKKSERYYQEFLLLPGRENQTKAARLKIENDKAKALLIEIDARIVTREIR